MVLTTKIQTLQNAFNAIQIVQYAKMVKLVKNAQKLFFTIFHLKYVTVKNRDSFMKFQPQLVKIA
jgi:DNA-binding MurR/RpiR family transcriptional regulator